MIFEWDRIGTLKSAILGLEENPDLSGVVVERNMGDEDSPRFWQHIATRVDETDKVLSFVHERGFTRAQKVQDGLIYIEHSDTEKFVEALNAPEDS